MLKSFGYNRAHYAIGLAGLICALPGLQMATYPHRKPGKASPLPGFFVDACLCHRPTTRSPGMFQYKHKNKHISTQIHNQDQ
ncbi:low-affinity gluconate transporter [Salmonella enterica subsp. arizonae]|nr:low-affinity gluconate transporter [Salmonella enterica subsp. arizonae]